MELKVENLIKSFEEKRVIKGADYSFEKGKIYGLLGRNGAGKTTLFNCISGEMDFDSGKIYMTDEENSESMNYEKIGYVYSTPILPEFLTGYEFIRFFTDINKKKIKNIKTPEEFSPSINSAFFLPRSLFAPEQHFEMGDSDTRTSSIL